MQERIEVLEREVMELRVQLRVLQQVLHDALDSIEGAAGDSYMSLWDGDDEERNSLKALIKRGRIGQRELPVLEAQLAYTKDKGSDEALYLAKQVEMQRSAAHSYRKHINYQVRGLIEANIIADHNWHLEKVVYRMEAHELRVDACVNPNCHAKRTALRFFRNGQVERDSVVGTDPKPMALCPWDVAEIRAELDARLTSTEEDIPF